MCPLDGCQGCRLVSMGTVLSSRLVMSNVVCSPCSYAVAVSVSLSAQNGIVALGKAYTRSAPCLSSFPKVALETLPIFVSLNADHSRPWEWNIGLFISPLFFPSGDQCYDALACPCSESSSSLRVPLPCQAADQM